MVLEIREEKSNMSHVADLKMQILDVDCLIEAAGNCGLIKRDKRKFKWFGQHVGDYPLPEGFTKGDMGKCEFALGIDGNDNAYEIGVVKRRDGQPGYTLLWDFWAGGHGLEAAIGSDGERLKMEYTAAVNMKQARRLGHRIDKSYNQDGEIVLRVRS